MADTLKKQVDEARRNIESLKFRLAVEEAVLARLVSVQEVVSQDLWQHRENAGRPTMPGSFTDKAAAILREHGKPMRARDIARILAERGVTDGGKTSILSLIISAMRRRKDVFKPLSRGVYGLVKEEAETENQKKGGEGNAP